jgi:hypothetical protein
LNDFGNLKRIVVPDGSAYPGFVGSRDLSRTIHASNLWPAANPVLTIGWYSTLADTAWADSVPLRNKAMTSANKKTYLQPALARLEALLDISILP